MSCDYCSTGFLGELKKRPINKSLWGVQYYEMMSDQMMADLNGATGTEAARLYLEGMIRHHQGAIEASETELVDGAYPPALKLADEIKQGQAAEITTMQALLASL